MSYNVTVRSRLTAGRITCGLRRCDGPESLLASCVPDLQLHPLAIDVHSSDLEVHADGGDVAACRSTSSRVQLDVHVYPTNHIRFQLQTEYSMNAFPMNELLSFDSL